MSAARALSMPQTIDGQLEVMERILRGQLELWRRVVSAIDVQREALRSADGPTLERAAIEQQQLTKPLATLDQQRERLAAMLQKQAVPGVRDILPLMQLLSVVTVDLQQRDRMMALARDLRETIETAKRRGGVVRDAAETLARHVMGIQQIVHSALSRAGVYGRRGRLALGSATPAAVDMKS